MKELLDEELYRVTENAKNSLIVRNLDGSVYKDQLYQIGSDILKVTPWARRDFRIFLAEGARRSAIKNQIKEKIRTVWVEDYNDVNDREFLINFEPVKNQLKIYNSFEMTDHEAVNLFKLASTFRMTDRDRGICLIEFPNEESAMEAFKISGHLQRKRDKNGFDRPTIFTTFQRSTVRCRKQDRTKSSAVIDNMVNVSSSSDSSIILTSSDSENEVLKVDKILGANSKIDVASIKNKKRKWSPVTIKKEEDNSSSSHTGLGHCIASTSRKNENGAEIPNLAKRLSLQVRGDIQTSYDGKTNVGDSKVEQPNLNINTANLVTSEKKEELLPGYQVPPAPFVYQSSEFEKFKEYTPMAEFLKKSSSAIGSGVADKEKSVGFFIDKLVSNDVTFEKLRSDFVLRLSQLQQTWFHSFLGFLSSSSSGQSKLNSEELQSHLVTSYQFLFDQFVASNQSK